MNIHQADSVLPMPSSIAGHHGGRSPEQQNATAIALGAVGLCQVQAIGPVRVCWSGQHLLVARPREISPRNAMGASSLQPNAEAISMYGTPGNRDSVYPSAGNTDPDIPARNRVTTLEHHSGEVDSGTG